MTDLRDIQILQEERDDKKETRRSIFPAILVALNGSVVPNNRPNYVYFQELGTDETSVGVAWNTAVKPLDQLPVLIGRNPTHDFRLEIIGLYTSDVIPGVGIASPSLAMPEHAISHEYETETSYGEDVVRVFNPAIQMLKTSFLALNITTQPHSYIYQGKRYFFTGITQTLTASSAGYVRYVLVYLNPATNSIVLVDGTEVLDNGVIPILFPDIPDKAIPSCYVKVDDSTIVEVIDSRDFLYSGEFPSPSQDGDILIGEGGEYVSGKPIVDRFGQIITSNGVIVTI